MKEAQIWCLSCLLRGDQHCNRKHKKQQPAGGLKAVQSLHIHDTEEAAIMEASRENVLEGEGVMKVPAPVQAAIVEARRENVRILFPACDALFCLVVSNSPATCAFWLCSRGTRLSGRGIRRDRHIEVYMDVCSC